jgi:glucose-6-phosphate 1-dehydrogenase
VFQIQPHEGIDLDFLVKRPGPQVEAVSVALDFAYAEKFAVAHRTGYETLLYDMMMGDQTLFQRADQIEAGWALCSRSWTPGLVARGCWRNIRQALPDLAPPTH